MTVGEVSQRSGLPVSTIHFYESKGLIQSERTSGNQRRYSPAILRYLAIVKVAQRAGLSLDEVLDALGQYQPGVHLTAAHWRRVASRWREDLDDRITQLMRLRDELGDVSGAVVSLSKSARCVIRATYSQARGPVRVSLSENRRDL